MRNAKPNSPSAKRMVSDLGALVAFDTCFPPASDYPGFCDLIERLTADLDCTSERVEIPAPLWTAEGVSGTRVNLLLRPSWASGPEAMIYFHTDTAPVGDGWTRPPLAVTKEGERLFGRGVADMKGCIAAVIEALRVLKESGTPTTLSPLLAFCTDEEGGRYPGIRHLAKTRPLPRVLLNLNGEARPRIWAGCFGSMDFAITGIGRTAHSGRPDMGVNALEEMAPAIAALLSLKPRIEARVSAMPARPGDDPLRARLNITACHAGDTGSAIPGRCRLVVNRRYMPEETAEAVRTEIRETVEAALSDSHLTDWRIDEIGHLPPVTDPDGPYTDAWTRARAQAYGIPETDFARYGASSSSDFGWVQLAGVRHMLLGGLSRPEANIHGPDENTTLSDLTALSRAVLLFLTDTTVTKAGSHETGKTTDKEMFP